MVWVKDNDFFSDFKGTITPISPIDLSHLEKLDMRRPGTAAGLVV